MLSKLGGLLDTVTKDAPRHATEHDNTTDPRHLCARAAPAAHETEGNKRSRRVMRRAHGLTGGAYEADIEDPEEKSIDNVEYGRPARGRHAPSRRAVHAQLSGSKPLIHTTS